MPQMVAPTDRLIFRGGWLMAFVPIAIFLVMCVQFFVVFKAFDMTALAMSGILALLVGAAFAKNYSSFWDAVMRGIGSPTSVTIVVILLVIGMFSELVKVTNVSSGFVWLGDSIGVSGGAFTAFAFITVGLVAMATGSSIGTMFTAFPIFYPAGVLLGADPSFLAGAIVSGAILGDNVAPISDTTIISSSTQKFRRKQGVADISGVVSSRVRYALTAAGISAVLFLILGGGTPSAGGNTLAAEVATPASLIMLIPVAIMLATAFVTRNIFKAVSVGLVLGGLTGLLFNLITPDQIIGVTEGTPSGLLISGVAGMLGTVALVISVFGIMGVLNEAGVLDRVVDSLVRGRLARTPRGAEAAIGIGISATTLLFGGVNSASMMTFGPVADEIGSRVNLHPYRRANVMDCFALGLSSVVPFLSAYLFIGALLTGGHEGIPSLATTQIFPAMLYPLTITLVMIFAVWTGWGRRFEGPDGAVSKTQDTSLSQPVNAPADVY